MDNNEPKIILKQTHIEVNNYEMGDCIKLENFFSMYDMIRHTQYFKALDYIPEQKKLLIPRGIDIRWLENLFMTEAVVDRSYDKFDMIGDILIKYLPRDDVQKEALRFMIGVKEYRNNTNKSELMLSLNTGKGKTYVSIATIAYLRIKSIIITASVDWLNQWKNFILEYTDIAPREIYFISGSGSIARLLQKPDRVSKYKIFLVSHNTIKNFGDTNGWDKITELFKVLKVGLKFFDEAHLNFDNTMKINFYTNTYRTYDVTATPKRSNEEENNIYAYAYKNIPSIDLFDQDKDPRTQYIAFRYNSHPTAQNIADCKNQYGLDRNKYIGYVVHQENFHNMLHILIDRIKKTNGKVLIYIGTNASIEYVYNWIKDNYPEIIECIGIYTSIISSEQKEEQLSRRIILSTTKSCGAAMDIKGLKLTIVLAEPFKSEVLARQTLGRTRDNDTIYIDIVDDGFFYTKKFYEYKKPVFDKYATECTEVKLYDEELKSKARGAIQDRNSLIYPIRFGDNDFLIEPVTFGDED